MPILHCIKSLKLDYDTNGRAVAVIEDDKTQYVQGTFWKEDEYYEVNVFEENALLNNYPECFERM